MIEITEAHVEALARRLARDNPSLDPDDLVYLQESIDADHIDAPSPIGIVRYFSDKPTPLWHYYREEARAALNWLREGGG